MKESLHELIELLKSSAVPIVYKKLNGDTLFEKYFVKSYENFCENETGNLKLISYAEEKEEIVHESQIFGYRIYGEDHDMTFIKSPEDIKADYQYYFKKAINLKNFDEMYFNPNTDLQKLKVCAVLELSSIEELEDNSLEALNKLKGFWRKQIELHKQQTIEHINSELLVNSAFDKEAIEEIKNLVIEYDATNELFQIQTKQELFEFWPTLLLPAPDFINDIFVDLFRFSKK